MNPSDVRLDALGFPIPATFDSPGPTGPVLPEPPHRARRVIRVLLVALALGAGGMALARAELGEPIRKVIAEWLASHAEQKYAVDDVDGALRDLDRAVGWSANLPGIYALRGQIRAERGDLTGAVDDFTNLIRLSPQTVQAYALRANALQRQKRHEEAIGDITQAMSLRRNADPGLLNARAYMRAIAERELDEALVDVQQAIDLEGENAHYLDTRGYILFLQGNYEEALKDLSLAVEIAEASEPPVRRRFMGNHAMMAVWAREKRQHDHDLAVMHHHLGQVHEKLGNDTASQLNLQLGQQLGYDPEAGVY